MVRLQSFLVVFVCAWVPLCAVGVQTSRAGEDILPVSADLVADAGGKTEMGYAEADNATECDPCLTPCSSLWTFGAGAIFLNRNHATAEPTAKIYRGTTRQTYEMIHDMRDSDLGMAVGPDITLARCLGPCWDVEARYFQVDGWNDRQDFSSPNGVLVSAYGSFASSSAIAYTYSSRLYNVEMNMRWKHWERLPLLIGFRTLGLDEQFQTASTSGGTYDVGTNTETNNALYGLQVGAEPVLWDRCGRFRIDGLFKAGIYGNNAHQRTSFPHRGSTTGQPEHHNRVRRRIVG